MHTRSSSRTGKIRNDRKDRLVFTPNIDVRKEVRVRALIDRMVIVLKTTAAIDAKVLHKGINSKTGATNYAHDRCHVGSNDSWKMHLPELAHLTPTRQHFAILLQDIDLKVLTAVLKGVTNCVGIDGPVRPFMVELAVDFYPKVAQTPEEMLVGREKIVALLQRHHWASHQALLDETAIAPKRSDARQTYTDAAGKLVTRRMFAQKSGANDSDSQLYRPEVRHRIMGAVPGNDLYLNAHIYRGTQISKVQTNVQHKVEDRRDAVKRTSVKLTPAQCRGRVEFTLTGFDTLGEAGIEDISDLSQVSFKAMAKQLIKFRLPTSKASAEDVGQTISEMTHRGVYGVELRQRADT